MTRRLTPGAHAHAAKRTRNTPTEIEHSHGEHSQRNPRRNRPTSDRVTGVAKFRTRRWDVRGSVAKSRHVERKPARLIASQRVKHQRTRRWNVETQGGVNIKSLFKLFRASIGKISRKVLVAASSECKMTYRDGSATVVFDRKLRMSLAPFRAVTKVSQSTRVAFLGALLCKNALRNLRSYFGRFATLACVEMV